MVAMKIQKRKKRKILIRWLDENTKEKEKKDLDQMAKRAFPQMRDDR